MSETLARTPLHALHVELGARIVPFAGWEMPVQYAGIIEEHQAVRKAAGLFDVSHMGEARIRGRDAAAFLDRMFEGLRKRYERRLHRTLEFRAMSVLVLVGVLAITAIMYLSTPRELAPEEDQGFIVSIVKTPQYANLDYLENMTGKLQKEIAKIPENEHVFAINGSGGVRQAFAGLILKPWEERKRSQKQVLQDLQSKLTLIPGAQAFAFAPPALPGSAGGPPVQFVIRTTGDYQQLAGVLAEMQQAAQKSGLFIFTDADLKFDTPQIEFKIDADKANRLGVSMQDVGSSLATFLGGNYVNRFSLYGRSYQVIPQAPREFRITGDWLLRYQVRTTSGELVPLSSIATVTQTVQPNALTNFQQLSSATLSGVPFPGRTIGETIDFLTAKAKEIFPEGYTYDFQGDSRQYVQEGNTLAITFLFALIVIFLVLAAQFSRLVVLVLQGLREDHRLLFVCLYVFNSIEHTAKHLEVGQPLISGAPILKPRC